MAQLVREVMTGSVVTCPADAPIRDAAAQMREADIGDVIVLDDDHSIRGMLTDRDITVRAVADGRDPAEVTCGEICSTDVLTVGPDDDIDTVISQMRQRAIRRTPVVDGGQPVGIISIGDLAVERDPDSALADVSAAPPNT